MNYFKNITVYNTTCTYKYEDDEYCPYKVPVIAGSYGKEYDAEYLEFSINSVFTNIFKNIGCPHEFYFQKYIEYIHTFENSVSNKNENNENENSVFNKNETKNNENDIMKCINTNLTDSEIIDKIKLLIKNIRYCDYTTYGEYKYKYNIKDYISKELLEFINCDMFNNPKKLNEDGTLLFDFKFNTFDEIVVNYDILKCCKGNLKKLLYLDKSDLQDLQDFIEYEIRYIEINNFKPMNVEECKKFDKCLSELKNIKTIINNGIDIEKVCNSIYDSCFNSNLTINKITHEIEIEVDVEKIFNNIFNCYSRDFNLKLNQIAHETENELIEYLKNVNDELMTLDKGFMIDEDNKLYIEYENYPLNFNLNSNFSFIVSCYDEWHDEYYTVNEIYYNPLHDYNMYLSVMNDKNNIQKYFVYTAEVKYYKPKHKYLNSSNKINKYFSNIVCESSNLFKYFMSINDNQELYDLNLCEATNFKFTELIKIQNEEDYAEFIHLMISYVKLDILNDNIKRIFNELIYLQCDEVLDIIQYCSKRRIMIFK